MSDADKKAFEAKAIKLPDFFAKNIIMANNNWETINIAGSGFCAGNYVIKNELTDNGDQQINVYRALPTSKSSTNTPNYSKAFDELKELHDNYLSQLAMLIKTPGTDPDAIKTWVDLTKDYVNGSEELKKYPNINSNLFKYLNFVKAPFGSTSIVDNYSRNEPY